jgi:hypothetical protein
VRSSMALMSSFLSVVAAASGDLTVAGLAAG